MIRTVFFSISNILRCCLFVLMVYLLTSFSLYGQSRGELEVFGRLEQAHEPLSNGVIRIYLEGRMVESSNTNSRGRFSFVLLLEREYIIAFTAPGLVTKRIMFDTRLENRRTRQRFFEFDFVVDLFPEIDGIDFSFFEEPLATISYIDEINRFFFQESETSPRLRRANEIHRQVVDLIRRREAYAVSIQQADNYFRNQTYQLARDTYLEANGFLPDEIYPLQRVEEIDNILSQNQDVETQYTNLITNADREFNANLLTEARDKYVRASDLKKDQAYPKQRITEIDQRLAREQETKSNYNRMIEAADNSFRQQQYELAKSQYENASGFLPGEEYPREKIIEINRLLANLSRTEREYNALINRADAEFSARRLEQSKGLYLNALEIKSSETYPRERIAEIDNLLAERELRAQRQKEQQKQELEKEQERQRQQEQQRLEEQERLAEQQREQERLAQAQRLLAERREQEEREAQEKIRQEQEQQRLEAERIERQRQLEQQRLEEQERLAEQQREQERLAQAQRLLAERREQEEREAQEKIRQEQEQQRLEAERIENQRKQEQQRLQEQERLAEQQREQERLARAQQLLAERREQEEREEQLRNQQQQNQQKSDAQYAETIQSADRAFNSRVYVRAAELYQEAITLQPDEQYPKSRLAEVNNILNQNEALPKRRIEENDRRISSEDPGENARFNNAIRDADRLFAQRQFFGSRDAYQLALSIRADEAHPINRIVEINRILANSAEMAAFYAKGFMDVSNVNEMIRNNGEKRYHFVPFDQRRRGSYVLLAAENLSGRNLRLFINYGKDDQRSGGFSVNIGGDIGVSDLRISISDQTRWITDDNNWISITPVGGDIDLHTVKLYFGN